MDDTWKLIKLLSVCDEIVEWAQAQDEELAPEWVENLVKTMEMARTFE